MPHGTSSQSSVPSWIFGVMAASGRATHFQGGDFGVRPTKQQGAGRLLELGPNQLPKLLSRVRARSNPLASGAQPSTRWDDVYLDLKAFFSSATVAARRVAETPEAVG